MPDSIKGRGASFNPLNRFDTLHREPLEIELEAEEAPPLKTIFYNDTSKTILCETYSLSRNEAELATQHFRRIPCDQIELFS